MEKETEKLGILISTYGEGMQSVIETVLPTIDLDKAIVVVNHQRSDLYDGNIPKDDSIIYHESDSVGLSKSRNECIELTPCEINVIADDDIEYQHGFEEKVLNAFKESGADIVTFQTTGQVKRTQKPTKHTWGSLLLFRAKSIEISFRKSSIIEARVTFDEDFGLGSKYPTGEENIFLQDCNKAGLAIWDYPIEAVSHPHETSGSNLTKEMFGYKKKMFIRMFGFVKGFIVFLIFFFKKSLDSIFSG